jgi:fructose transport system substrate-binding protein
MGVSRTLAVLLSVSLSTSALTGCRIGPGQAAMTAPQIVGVVVKTFGNPFFASLVKGAQQEGKALGITVKAYAGTKDGDTASQIKAIEELIAQRAQGILITPSGNEVLPAVDKARKAGLLVIALDSPTDPANAVDATFATDNFGAGQAIGQWAHGQLDPAAARIAMLDLSADRIPVDVARDQGFLNGFGIDTANPSKIGDETDRRIVGHADTGGSVDGGKQAMTELLAKSPTINLVYTINEPAAAGAYEVLKSAGKAKGVIIVSVDGGCEGVRNVESGIIGATSMQFPLRMARLGLDAVIDHSLTGQMPPNTPGMAFFNTGVQLIASKPVAGLYSKDPAWGAKNCWG